MNKVINTVLKNGVYVPEPERITAQIVVKFATDFARDFFTDLSRFGKWYAKQAVVEYKKTALHKKKEAQRVEPKFEITAKKVKKHTVKIKKTEIFEYETD